jgi:hypothetical protein
MVKTFVFSIKSDATISQIASPTQKQKHVRKATHASNFFPQASLHNVAL